MSGSNFRPPLPPSASRPSTSAPNGVEGQATLLRGGIAESSPTKRLQLQLPRSPALLSDRLCKPALFGDDLVRYVITLP